MVRPRQVIDNPATGERIKFRKTADDTAGESLQFDYYLRPGGFALGRVDHVHPRQEERIAVRSGRLGVRIDGDEWTATPDTSFAVLPRTPHTVWNDGDEAVHAVIEIRPALDIETLFETAFGLARDGMTVRWGLPTPLQAAVVADAFREEFAVAGAPLAVQRGVVAPLASLGRLLGYQSRYPGHENADGITSEVEEPVADGVRNYLSRK